MSAYGGQAYDANQIASITLLSVLLAIVVVLILLRGYVRIYVKHALGWDDGLAFVSFLLAIVSAAFIFLKVYYGSGQHVDDLIDEDYQVPMALKWNLGYQMANITGTCFMRESIMALLLRLQPKQAFRYWIYLFMTVMAITTIILFGLFLAECQPLYKVWYIYAPGTCLSPNTVYNAGYAQSAISILVDLFCTISPVILLWNIKINLKKKLWIMALMSLGLISTASIALRNAFIPEKTSTDVTWDAPILIVTIIEQYVGLIAACIPVVATVVAEKGSRLFLRLRYNLTGRESLLEKPGPSTYSEPNTQQQSDGFDEGPEQSAEYPEMPVIITRSAYTSQHQRTDTSFDTQESVSGMYNEILRD